MTGSNQHPTFPKAAGRGYQPDEGELRKDLVASTTMGSLNAPTCIRLWHEQEVTLYGWKC